MKEEIFTQNERGKRRTKEGRSKEGETNAQKSRDYSRWLVGTSLATCYY